MSGRHLQHGDATQPGRTQELFSNCSTSCTSFALFYLLMNGSGVGRCYDDEMMLVNWDNAPSVRCVIDESHPDFDFHHHESVRDAKHKYGSGRDVMWFKVPDTREGWAQAIEIYENAAYEKIHRDKTLILDFSDVRSSGTPIGGMQGRPASGPVPLMDAIMKISMIKNAGLEPWMQSMHVDHYLASAVLSGGVRRAARISCKYWKNKTIFDFIKIKRPIEYEGKTAEEVIEFRKTNKCNAFLWSSNNSVTVDEEFWERLNLKPSDKGYDDPMSLHARKVFKAITECSYADGSGEPAFVNVNRLTQKDDGWEGLEKGDYIGSKKYQIRDDTQIYLSKLAKRAKKLKFHQLVNPCGLTR
jgi:hypothetical protein